MRTSDVVVDNFRRGVTERLGIDYESLRKVNPNIITVSVMGFGPTGPLAGEPGFDPVLQARGGLMAAQGGDDEPVFHTVAVNDEASGLMSAFATVTALYARARTGRGQHVWTSLANQSVVTQSGELTTWRGRAPMPLGDRDCPGSRPCTASTRVRMAGSPWRRPPPSTQKRSARRWGARRGSTRRMR